MLGLGIPNNNFIEMVLILYISESTFQETFLVVVRILLSAYLLKNIEIAFWENSKAMISL